MLTRNVEVKDGNHHLRARLGRSVQDVPDVGNLTGDVDLSSTLVEIESTVGPYLGPILIVVSLFLMWQGHRRIGIVGGLAGGSIGFFFGSALFDLLEGLVEGLEEIHVQIGAAVLGALIVNTMLQSAFRLMGAGLALLALATLMRYLEENGIQGIDRNTESVIGIVVTLAMFIASRGLRHIMPMLFSAALAGVSLMSAYLLMIEGAALSSLDPLHPDQVPIQAALALLALLTQRLDAKRVKIRNLKKAGLYFDEKAERKKIDAEWKAAKARGETDYNAFLQRRMQDQANREAKAKRTRAKFKQPAAWNNTSAQRMDAMRAQTTTKAFFTRPNELGLHRARVPMVLPTTPKGEVKKRRRAKAR